MTGEIPTLGAPLSDIAGSRDTATNTIGNRTRSEDTVRDSTHGDGGSPKASAKTATDVNGNGNGNGTAGSAGVGSVQEEHEETRASEREGKKDGVGAKTGAGAAAAEGAAASKVQEQDKYHFYHPQVKKQRGQALKVLGLVFLLMALWVWACLSLFWGSTYLIEDFFPKLNFFLIPLDESSSAFLNSPLIQQAGYENALPNSVPHVSWTVRSPSDYPNGLADVRADIVAQRCWAALVVNANATTAWQTALTTGDASYDPTGAMGFYYSSARFYQVVLLYFIPILGEFIANPLATARTNALQSFVSSFQGNQTALELAAQVPQAIGVGFGYTQFDVRPIENNQWAGAAPMEAGLIYFVIFAFCIALYAAQGRLRTGLAGKLRFPSMLKIRLAWPIFCYFWMSLAFTTIERAWQIPMENVLGRGGFPALWALNFVTIWAAGWAMETVTALVGPMNLPFFLILWIILNISSSFFPIELMNRFYRLLRAMPFYHNIEAYKIITYGTNLTHRLGLHFGVLFAIIGVECICFPLALAFERWNMDRTQAKAAAAKQEQERRDRTQP